MSTSTCVFVFTFVEMTKTKNIFEEAVETSLPSSGEETDIEDEDTCNAFELEQMYEKYEIADESAVTLKKDYILSLCRDSSFTRIVAGLSNASVQLFDISATHGLQPTHIDVVPTPTMFDPNNPINICGLRFLDETPNNLLVGTTNGLIRLFDLRTNKETARFENNDSDCGGSVKTITCFDGNANGRILCAGTEQHQHNVYLLFYDVRERKQLGGYFESHEDDVTALRFHAQNPDLLCTGSTDGLINIFNINESCEDDALMNTINTESSIHKLNWHKNVYEKDIISCITHTNDFKAYECDECDMVANFDRSNITISMSRKNNGNINLISAHNTHDDGIFLLAGTNSNKGETMRSLRLQNKQLMPLADFVGNKQIVRESVYDSKQKLLITAGESGIITLWTPRTNQRAINTTGTSHTRKSQSKQKSKKKTPY